MQNYVNTPALGVSAIKNKKHVGLMSSSYNSGNDISGTMGT